jgi:predicted O-methyltransferase YrrM
MTEQARQLARTLSGNSCLSCEQGQSWAPCTCPRPVEEAPVPDDMILPDIASAVTREEAAALADLARGKTVLELGAHLGFSTVVLASVAAEVISVDWHLGDAHAGLGDTWAAFCSNLDRYGVADRVTVIHGRFEDVLPSWAASPGGVRVDGCFLDGMHDEESVTRDTALALPLIRPGGFMSWHDYGRGTATGNPGFAVTEVADRYGVTGVTGHLAWWLKPEEGIPC